ncbi:MAG: phosphoribosyltransferase family protein [Burkholderiaceae bacterium]
MATGNGQRTTLYSTTQLELVLSAMAAAMAAKLSTAQQVALVGIRRRGAPLADTLLERLRPRLPASDLTRIDLLVQRYADDLTLLHPHTQLTEQPEHAQINLSDRVVVLVDDVLYGGYSMNKAVQYLLSKGVKTIYSAVLVDRQCSRLPVRADIAGLHLEVAPGCIVECHVPPFEPLLQIVLVQPDGA